MTVRLPAGQDARRRPVPDPDRVLGLPGRGAARPARVGVDQLAGGGLADPLAPATSTAVGSLIGPLLGFAVVSVQMRGSGCSGGAFDLFDLPDHLRRLRRGRDRRRAELGQGRQGRDGRHLVLRASPSSSSPGTRPPHLAAIAPMSVTDDTLHRHRLPGRDLQLGLRQDLDPGAHGRRASRRPRAASRTPRALVQAGRQALHRQPEAPPPDPGRAQAPATRTRSARRRCSTQRAPGPVAQARQGARRSSSASSRTSRPAGTSPRASGTSNATRTSGSRSRTACTPTRSGRRTITRWAEFLKLYVAGEVPQHPAVGDLASAASLYQFLADAAAAPGAAVALRRHHRRRRRARPLSSVTRACALLMDNGAGPAGPGLARRDVGARVTAPGRRSRRAPRATSSASAARSARKPVNAGSARYTADPRRPAEADAARRRRGGRLEGAAALRLGAARGRQGPGLRDRGARPRTLVIAGPSSLDLYLKSSARDTDLQVTLSEVRPDGNETYVQNGWLRASHRKLDPQALHRRSTRSRRTSSRTPRRCQAARCTLVRVPIYPVAHAFRAGSRIRVTVQAAGRRPPALGLRHGRQGHDPQHDRARRRAAPRALVLPVVAGATAKGTPLPGRRRRCAASPTAPTRPPPTAAERRGSGHCSSRP